MNHCKCLKLKKELKDLKKEYIDLYGCFCKLRLELKSYDNLNNILFHIVDNLQGQINDLKHGK